MKNNFILGQDEEPAAPPIKCYVCGGADGKCSSPDDLGIEKTCDAGTFTCIVATESTRFENGIDNKVFIYFQMMKFTEGVTPQQHNMKTVSMEGTFVIAW